MIMPTSYVKESDVFKIDYARQRNWQNRAHRANTIHGAFYL